MNNLFILNGSTGNRGCEAILVSTHDLLSQAYPSADFINSSTKDNRAATANYLRLPNLRHKCHPAVGTPAWIAWQFAKRFTGRGYYFEAFLPWADTVFSLGGDNYSLDYGSAHSYFDANERVMAAGKKLVIWGASIGPFTADPELELRAAEQLKRIHRIVVRENRSEAYLRTLGVTDNVVLMPDPAFSLRAEEFLLPASIENALVGGAIGINLSPLLAKYRKTPEKWVSEAAAWVQSILTATSMPAILIPHVMQPGNDDAAFMNEVLKLVNADTSRLLMLDGENLSCTQLKYIISRTKCFIGARTHATIAAMSSSVPTLSIGYSVKAVGINEDVFGSDEWVVDHKDLTGETLTQKTVAMLARGDEIRSQLAEKNLTYRMTPSAIRDAIS